MTNDFVVNCNNNNNNNTNTNSTDGIDNTNNIKKIPKLFLLLENPSKSNNLGPILRCATAFGIRTVITIGYAKCSTEGSHGASKHIQIINYPTTVQAKEFLQSQCSCTTIIGIMGIVPNSYNTTKGYKLQYDESKDSTDMVYIATKNNNNNNTVMDTDTTDPFDHNIDTIITTTTTTNNPLLNKNNDSDEHNDNDSRNKPYYGGNLQSHRSYPIRNHPIIHKLLVSNQQQQQQQESDVRDNNNNNNICITLSKVSNGISLQLAQICTIFCHIPYPSYNEHPSIPSTLLDPQACLSIVLFEVTSKLGYKERSIHDTKFIVTNINQQYQYQQRNINNNNNDTHYVQQNDDNNQFANITKRSIVPRTHNTSTTVSTNMLDNDDEEANDDICCINNLFEE